MVGSMSREIKAFSVSHHLKILKDAGAVTLIKRGTKNYYFVDAASSEWEALWAFADATRALSCFAHAKGYPKAYEDDSAQVELPKNSTLQ